MTAGLNLFKSYRLLVFLGFVFILSVLLLIPKRRINVDLLDDMSQNSVWLDEPAREASVDCHCKVGKWDYCMRTALEMIFQGQKRGHHESCRIL